MAADLHDEAARMVASMLNAQEQRVTTELVQQFVDAALTLPQFGAAGLDHERIVRLVKATINVWVPAASVLEDNTDHIDWLALRRAEIEWTFWDRYRLWLESRKGFPTDVVRKTDDVTDNILGRLEDPHREGAWDRRGLVAGQVQSGKTSNYLGLACKAADAGYKLIVVLAGIHNSLRSQTQARLDEGLLGIDSQTRERIGVGALPSQNRPMIHSLTSSADNGDFKLATANAATVRLGSDPIVVVIKKNATILQNFLEWVTSLNAIEGEDGRSIVEGIPMLLIDDEADSASINTKDKEADPTKVNQLIRMVLKGFEKVAYVGYTATPFANLYINEERDHPEYGRDLFPRSFIVALRPPSNYTGPGDVFGASSIPELDRSATEGLPIVRSIADYEGWIPDRHKKELVPGPLPASLTAALRSFVLASTIRRVRGQDTHNSMLVHVTRFTAVQGLVFEQIDDWLSRARNEIRYGGEQTELRDQLKALWEADFAPTTAAIAELHPDRIDPTNLAMTWGDITAELEEAINRIEVRRINGTAKDALDYTSAPNPLNVIAVGGDKLSRGLTLEGLTVSYYLRASKMYDTLMQMGRWFGYRPGYLDLCRLHTTHELIGWYRDIAAASEELWSDFEAMAAAHENPETFGLRVRSHPDGLLVTAANKMRDGEKRSLSYAASLTESVIFDAKKERVEKDYKTLSEFVDSLHGGGHAPAGTAAHHYSWTRVSPEDVADFLENLYNKPIHSSTPRANPSLIANYIRRAASMGELSDWTVVLVNSKGREPRRLANCDVGYTTRSRQDGGEDGVFRIRRLLDPTHECLDLSEQERSYALQRTVEAWIERTAGKGTRPVDPSGTCARRARSKDRGLLLLYPLVPVGQEEPDLLPFVGYGVSLPPSTTAPQIEYIVNNVYAQQEIDFADEA
ncbi:MAG: Z1 domain-containing protein [Acidimicrobiales bacterium]